MYTFNFNAALTFCAHRSNAEIVSLLERGCSEEFGRERLQGLLKMLPSSDELDMLSSVKEEERGRLGPPETFLLCLVQLPGYTLRIDALLLKEHFRSSLPAIQSSIDAILQAIHSKPVVNKSLWEMYGCYKQTSTYVLVLS